MNKIIFISEALSAPFDEGIKNVAFSLHNQLQIKRNVISVTNEDNNTEGLNINKIRLNKLFLNRKIYKLLNNYSPNIIIYLPEASITFNSFVRAGILKLMNRSSIVVMLGVQHRKYSSIQKSIIKYFLKPDLLFLMSKSNEIFFLNSKMRVKTLPPAVDSKKFFDVSKEQKEKIRAEYHIPVNKKVVLHVGHIRKSRNIACLLEVQKIKNVQVVVVGSTSTEKDNKLKDRLVMGGIHVIDDYIGDISKAYKMSDIYVFPVLHNYSAIDMPLSVLEALACNLPVITTRFGGLVNYFSKNKDFKYFNNTEELNRLIKEINTDSVENRDKIKDYTWDAFADEVIAASEQIT